MIFKMYVDESSCNGIAKHLTNLKIKTARGKDKWHPDTIHYILQNEAYIGDIKL